MDNIDENDFNVKQHSCHTIYYDKAKFFFPSGKCTLPLKAQARNYTKRKGSTLKQPKPIQNHYSRQFCTSKRTNTKPKQLQGGRLKKLGGTFQVLQMSLFSNYTKQRDLRVS